MYTHVATIVLSFRSGHMVHGGTENSKMAEAPKTLVLETP